MRRQGAAMTRMMRAEDFGTDDAPPPPDLAAARHSPSGPVFTYAHPGQPAFRRRLIGAVERLSGRNRLERLYRAWQERPRDPRSPIFAEAMRELDLRIECSPAPAPAAEIPARGGLLVVANHPFGIADGLAVGALIAAARPDVKLMVHSALCQPPEARDVLLPVDFSAGAEARRTSAATRKAAVDWLDRGHALVIFPAGGVSTAPKPLSRRAADAEWHPFVARLAARPGVQVLPVFVEGQNSRLFQIVSHYSYPLRAALVIRETLRRRGRAVRLAVGQPFALTAEDRAAGDGKAGEGRAADGKAGEARAGTVARLRAAVFALAGPTGPRAEETFVFPRRIRW